MVAKKRTTKRTTKRKAKEPIVDTTIQETAPVVQQCTPDVEVTSRWFKIKLDDVNTKTIVVLAMFLIAFVVIVTTV